MKFLPFLAAFLLFAGCAVTEKRAAPQPIPLAEGLQADVAPLVEALLDLRGTAAQALAGEWKGRVFSAECVRQGDGQSLRLVFLAPQMRLATLVLSRPHALVCKRAREIPEAFKPEYALFDYALVNLSAPVLARALGPGFTVEETPAVRRVNAGARAVATLERAPDGSRRYANLLHGYSFTIRDVPAE